MHIWDVGTGQLAQHLFRKTQALQLAPSADGQWLLNTSQAGIFLHPASGARGGNGLLEIDTDGTDHGWEIRRARDLTLVAQQGNGNITAVTFGLDGCLFATGDDRGVIRVYRCHTERG